MNKDELHGGVRYGVGKVEKAIGDTVDSREWRVDGIVDQVAGGARHAYGRARSIAEDAIDSAPDLVDEARGAVERAGKRAAEGIRAGRDAAGRSLGDDAIFWALGAALAGYGLGWLIHGRHA